MIVHKLGDVLESDCKIIAHGCNCQGVMGSGIAKQIKDRYPEVYETYNRLCFMTKDKSKLLGTMQPCITQDGSRLIINAFTQLHYGGGVKQVSYDAVDSSMFEIEKLLFVKGTTFRVGMPRIGAGLGGGDWSIIETIMNHRFKSVSAEIYTLENN